MTFGMKVRTIKNGAPLALVLTLALVLVPVGASADPNPQGLQVCNTANQRSGDGVLVVDGLDQQGALHGNSSGLRAKSNGNLNAAMHSRALALCIAPDTEAGGNIDDGVIGGGTG